VGQSIETDVIVVGSGPAGSSAALFLSKLGVDNLVLTKYRWTANTPRAHITNQRTMEIMRDAGLEEALSARATPQELMANNVWATSMAGEELGRVLAWGNHPTRKAEYELASPSKMCDLPQNLLEPIVLGEAARLGSRVRFLSELLHFEQDEDGVTARVLDRATGDEFEARSRYMIGADGGRSRVAEILGLPMVGEHGIGMALNVCFHADLTRYAAHRPGVLFWIVQPGADHWAGGGTVRMVRPWDEWLAIFGHDTSQGEPDTSFETMTERVRGLIGDDSVRVEVHDVSKWTINHVVAARYSEGRVFCVGDAVHRHPPTNGLGSNTSIGDSYNLAWKLALVLDGKADPTLLETYNDERQPVGKQVVDRAIKSLVEYGPLTEAFGVEAGQSPEERLANLARRKGDTPEAAEQRRAIREGIELKNYEYNAHGIELGQRYRSEAVVPDGTPEPPYDRDPELYYHPTTWPGARLPHCWLVRNGEQISTHDLAGKGRFALFTGIGGGGWKEAAREVSERTGVEISAYEIGPGCDAQDLYDDWARLSEVGESGCVFVRPDGHVAWRCASLADAPVAELWRVVRTVLGLEQTIAGESPLESEVAVEV
jgi:2,4-dichlorophenol 6-monooxygenase